MGANNGVFANFIGAEFVWFIFAGLADSVVLLKICSLLFLILDERFIFFIRLDFTVSCWRLRGEWSHDLAGQHFLILYFILSKNLHILQVIIDNFFLVFFLNFFFLLSFEWLFIWMVVCFALNQCLLVYVNLDRHLLLLFLCDVVRWSNHVDLGHLALSICSWTLFVRIVAKSLLWAQLHSWVLGYHLWAWATFIWNWLFVFALDFLPPNLRLVFISLTLDRIGLLLPRSFPFFIRFLPLFVLEPCFLWGNFVVEVNFFKFLRFSLLEWIRRKVGVWHV